MSKLSFKMRFYEKNSVLHFSIMKKFKMMWGINYLTWMFFKAFYSKVHVIAMAH